jgi:hypothetical protein
VLLDLVSGLDPGELTLGPVRLPVRTAPVAPPLPKELAPLDVDAEGTLEIFGKKVPWAELRVGVLVEVLLIRHSLPVLDAERAWLSYRLYARRAGRFLEEGETLGSAGVLPGDPLVLFPERLEGAPWAGAPIRG